MVAIDAVGVGTIRNIIFGNSANGFRNSSFSHNNSIFAAKRAFLMFIGLAISKHADNRGNQYSDTCNDSFNIFHSESPLRGFYHNKMRSQTNEQ